MTLHLTRCVLRGRAALAVSAVVWNNGRLGRAGGVYLSADDVTAERRRVVPHLEELRSGSGPARPLSEGVRGLRPHWLRRPSMEPRSRQ